MFYKYLPLALVLSAAPLLAEDAAPAAPPPSPLFYDEPTLTHDNPKPFGLKLEFGQIHASGKSSYLSRNGGLGARYENGLDEVRLDGNGTYMNSEGEVIDHRQHYYLGYDRYLGLRLWLFLLGDWESNPPVGLKQTQLLGAGVKVDILRNRVYSLNVGVAYLKRSKQTEYDEVLVDSNGLPYEQHVVNTEDDEVVSARLKCGYSLDDLTFALVSFYQPVLEKKTDPTTNEEKTDYSWSVDASLAYNLTKTVYLKFAYFYKYESIPNGPGISLDEEKSTMALGYQF